MSATVSFEIKCEKCGYDLEATHYDNRNQLDVEPCKHCIKEAREQSRKEGYDEGYKEGEDAAKAEQV
jgi:hypothetical protein